MNPNSIELCVVPLQAAGGVAGSATRTVKQLYRTPGLSDSATKTLLKRAHRAVSDTIISIDSERCFNIEIEGTLSAEEEEKLQW